MNAATLDSIRRLAERPGTEHEGIVAREMLKRLEGKQTPLDRAKRSFAEQLTNHRLKDLDELLREHGISPIVTCPCGTKRKIFTGPCTNHKRHSEIYLKIIETFSRGDKVYYNYWAYPPNCPGVVAAHVPIGRENGTFPWAWISVKFSHLKSARRIPILNDAGEWCLTKEPK